MPKATLTFNLPEEQDEFSDSFYGWRYRAALDDLDGWLRNKFKYEDQANISIEEVRRKLREELDGIPFD